MVQPVTTNQIVVMYLSNIHCQAKGLAKDRSRCVCGQPRLCRWAGVIPGRPPRAWPVQRGLNGEQKVWGWGLSHKNDAWTNQSPKMSQTREIRFKKTVVEPDERCCLTRTSGFWSFFASSHRAKWLPRDLAALFASGSVAGCQDIGSNVAAGYNHSGTRRRISHKHPSLIETLESAIGVETCPQKRIRTRSGSFSQSYWMEPHDKHPSSIAMSHNEEKASSSTCLAYGITHCVFLEVLVDNPSGNLT